MAAREKRVTRDSHGRPVGVGQGRGKRRPDTLTPFGLYLRRARTERGLSQRDLAAQIGVSPAYLSALEHGQRGKPSFALVQRIIHALGVIWDEADDVQRLVELSDPKVSVDTRLLSASATELACRVANEISDWDAATIDRLLESLPTRSDRSK